MVVIQDATNCKMCGKRFIYYKVRRGRIYCGPCAIVAHRLSDTIRHRRARAKKRQAMEFRHESQ
jgi:transcription initiation factor TFIIIB Brf1 subunit/transcription initiation factor TFIIB